MTNYLPIEVFKNNKRVFWYMDISNLGLLDLLNLRKELEGNDSISVRKLDGIIYSQELDFCYNRSMFFKENKRNKTKQLKKMKYSKYNYHK